jgi:transcriptional regulator with XRE-family HTH domain
MLAVRSVFGLVSLQKGYTMTFLIEPKLFASNMRYYRERQSYSISALAQLTNLTTTVLQSLESGTHVPNEAQLAHIASALKVKKEELVLPRPPEAEYYEAC